MNRKIVLTIIILALCAAIMFGCSETDDYMNRTYPPSPTQTAPLLPTPRPAPDPSTRIWVNRAEISNISEAYSSVLSENKLNCHAGTSVVSLNLNIHVDRRIISHIYINGQRVDPETVNIDANFIQIVVPDNLPYLYSLEIKKGYKKDNRTMTENYMLEFLHEPALTCKISYYDTLLGEDTPPAIYITEENPHFLIEFSKPIDRDSLTLVRSSAILNHDIIWLSDTKALLYTYNLSNGYYTLGVESANGVSDIFGNRITMRSDYSNVLNFTIINEQKLYSVVPETGTGSLITQFTFGSFFESISKDSKYISIGIISNTESSLIYEPAFLSLGMKNLVPINSFIAGALTNASGYPAEIRNNMSYEPFLNKEYWTYDGRYIYYGKNDIYLIDPVTEKAELLFFKLDRFPAIVFPLKDGNFAAAFRPSDPNGYLSLLILTPDGTMLNEYELPFKEAVQDSWTRYLVHLAEADDDTLIISGMDNAYPMMTYRLELDDGTMTKVIERNFLFDVYPDLGYGLYYSYDTDSQSIQLEFIDFEGNVLHSIPINDYNSNNIIYNPHKNVFYMIEADYISSITSIKIIDAATFEITQSALEFENLVEIVGISQSGTLLLMDLISP